MTKLELLEAFFSAWQESLDIDGRSIEGRAAKDLLQARAAAILAFVPGPADIPIQQSLPRITPAVEEFRKLSRSIVNG